MARKLMYSFIRLLELAGQKQLQEALTPSQARQIFFNYGATDEDLGPQALRATRIRLMKANHPDTNPHADVAAAQDINAAYDTLKGGGGGYEEPATRRREPEPAEPAPWSYAGYSGGMPPSSAIHKHDYRDLNFIKKRMWELSGQSREVWNISGFDGSFLRNSLSVYGSPEIFADMAEAMVTWQTKGGNAYDCRAVIVSRSRSREHLLIWADGKSYARDPIVLEDHDSFNDNPSNDRQFEPRLRKLIDDMQENGGRLPDQPSFAAQGAPRYSPTLDVGDVVEHPKQGLGVVIKAVSKKDRTRVWFYDTKQTLNVLTASLKKTHRTYQG